MTDEQINEAITKATGLWDHPYSSDTRVMMDFCRDLNAMHEAEKVLDSDELFRGYYLALYDITKSTRWPVHATARQRAEAFLRTLGKWEEGK
jgi:hypothetical protein